MGFKRTFVAEGDTTKGVLIGDLRQLMIRIEAAGMTDDEYVEIDVSNQYDRYDHINGHDVALRLEA